MRNFFAHYFINIANARKRRGKGSGKAGRAAAKDEITAFKGIAGVKIFQAHGRCGAHLDAGPLPANRNAEGHDQPAAHKFWQQNAAQGVGLRFFDGFDIPGRPPKTNSGIAHQPANQQGRQNGENKPDAGDNGILAVCACNC